MKRYISAPCYKIIASDINDEMIPFEASLKYGVSEAYSNKDLLYQLDDMLTILSFMFTYDKRLLSKGNE